MTPTKTDDSALEARTYAKVMWRLVPFLFLCYVVSYLDRVNVGFAKLQMQGDLKLSDAVYGLGAGIFFIGYFLFEVPSNLLLHHVGARRWIARIMITWGLVSAATMFVNSAPTFYLLRLLLGMAEAGFFPGIILYLTYWFPAARRGRVVALFMSAIALSGVIGGPVSGWIMHALAGANGWAGWQWLFLLEGLPSIAMGFVVLAYLDDSIGRAKWLTNEEKQVLERNIAEDQRGREDATLGQVFASGAVWLLSAVYFCCIMGLYGVSFWLPQLIKSAGVKDVLDIGLLTAVPYGFAAVAMVLAARSSDRSGERRWHLAGAALAGAVGLALSGAYGGTVTLAIGALSLATMGILSSLPLFWTLPTALLRGSAAAAGIAIVNSVGNLAGFVSPYMIGAVKDATGSAAFGLYVLSGSLLLGAALVILGVQRQRQSASAAKEARVAA